MATGTLEKNPGCSSSERQYLLITNVTVANNTNNNDVEIDLYSESWKLPYSIEDEDLTFDGKPLCMLYEESRWIAEHHVMMDRSHDEDDSDSSSSDGGEKQVCICIRREFLL